MPEPDVTVAIPVRDGGALLVAVLEALAGQTQPYELLVCDSGSSDGSDELARRHGARVIEIAPERFGHGSVRNLLMREARGARVALLTQDAEPVSPRWLEELLGGFALAPDIGLVYGPYVPRPDAPAPVWIELERWFASLAGTSQTPRVDRLAEHERTAGASLLLGARGFFTDANACVARAAWERVPYREIEYAEDLALALDMMRAGYAKAFVPRASVLHSHSYSAAGQIRRSFDEWRGLREVYGWSEPFSPARLSQQLRGELSAARAAMHREGAGAGRRASVLAAVTRHYLLSHTGALLGSRAERLPRGLRAWLSQERRGGGPAAERADAEEIASR
jgi:rhamnosyltransferase